MNDKVRESWKRNFNYIDESAHIEAIQEKIHRAKLVLKELKLYEAKRIYTEIMDMYLDLDPKNRSKVYQDFYGLYREIKSAEKLEKVKKTIEIINEKAKQLNRKKLIKYAVPVALLLLIATGLFVFKPGITGYITLTQEKTYEDDLNLVMNESGNYTWTVDNIGDIQSIKASGRIKGNGTVKIYIEKDGQRYLIYDNKQEGNQNTTG